MVIQRYVFLHSVIYIGWKKIICEPLLVIENVSLVLPEFSLWSFPIMLTEELVSKSF